MHWKTVKEAPGKKVEGLRVHFPPWIVLGFDSEPPVNKHL